MCMCFILGGGRGVAEATFSSIITPGSTQETICDLRDQTGSMTCKASAFPLNYLSDLTLVFLSLFFSTVHFLRHFVVPHHCQTVQSALRVKGMPKREGHALLSPSWVVLPHHPPVSLRSIYAPHILTHRLSETVLTKNV